MNEFNIANILAEGISFLKEILPALTPIAVLFGGFVAIWTTQTNVKVQTENLRKTLEETERKEEYFYRLKKGENICELLQENVYKVKLAFQNLRERNLILKHLEESEQRAKHEIKLQSLRNKNSALDESLIVQESSYYRGFLNEKRKQIEEVYTELFTNLGKISGILALYFPNLKNDFNIYSDNSIEIFESIAIGEEGKLKEKDRKGELDKWVNETFSLKMKVINEAMKKKGKN